MRTRIFALLLALVLMVGTAFGKETAVPKPTLTPFATSVPTAAPQPDRWTTLLCHFDKPDSFDADVASGIRQASGCFEACKSGRPGKFGKAAFIGPEWGLLFYHGQANVNSPMGSADFWIKSAEGKNIWKDGRNHYLFGIHSSGWGAPEMLLKKTDRDTLQLEYLKRYRKRHPLLPHIEIPCAALSADEWHHLFISWDRRMGGLWLAIDGKGQCAKVPPRPDVPVGEVLAMYVGGRRYAYYLRETAGAYVDELGVTCRSVGWLKRHPSKSIEKETGISEKQLAQIAWRARRWFVSRAQWQRFGGWGGCGWPMRSKIGAYWWRSYVPMSSIVIWGKAGSGTAHYGALFLMAYETLQEQWLYDVVGKTGEMLLLTQSKEGWWRGQRLVVTPGGLKYDLPPVAPEKARWTYYMIQLDDLVQAKSMFLLCWLYRLRGDKRFLDAAIRNADFMCKAQNPNGGWGHCWHTKRQMCTNPANVKLWQGSEFEDSIFRGAFYQMLVIYRFTGDEKYLKAALRGADWVVSAQLKGATRGWAEQYDRDNVPAWGRPFEPPSCSMVAVREACDGLLAAWLITRDDKYIKPIESCVEWARGMRHRKGNLFYWTYDVKTGRPIAAHNRKIFFVDNPTGVREYKKAAARTKRGRMATQFDIGYWANVVKQARAGTLNPHCPFAAKKDLVEFLRNIPAKPQKGDIAHLRAAAILKGEIPFRPTLCTFENKWRDWPFWAYPYPDLYDKSAAGQPLMK